MAKHLNNEAIQMFNAGREIEAMKRLTLHLNASLHHCIA
jgi:hypothetical protein